MTDYKDKPGPPPDDFGETMPNIRTPDAGGSVDWDKTNYNFPKQPSPDEWGKTVANIKPIDTDRQDLGKTMYPGAGRVPEADWGATQANVRVPDADFGPGTGGQEPGYEKTTPYFQLPEAERQKYQDLPPTPTEKAAREEAEQKAKGGIPGWVWTAAGLTAMFLFAIVVLLFVIVFWMVDPSYEGSVRSAPKGSDIFVDDTSWGVTDPDGSKRLTTLRPGRHVITIRHPNFVCDPMPIEGGWGRNAPPVVARCREVPPKPGEDCGTFNPGEFDKAERCYNMALNQLPEVFTGDALVNALNILIINFETGRYDVPPVRLAALEKGAGFIKKLQDREPGLIIEVGGHTDSVGNDADNQTLSDNRARAVKDILIRYGVNPAGLQTRGYGETQPKFDNNTEQGKFLNRRIQYSVKR